jgi:predicted amidohydrolase YtcJ
MTHGYSILVGAVVLPGGEEPAAQAIAWAFDTILAIGSETAVRSISRGDSHVLDAAGGFVVPLEPSADARLEVGGPADLAILDRDPRIATTGRLPITRAIVRAGRVVSGALAELRS